MNKDRRGVGRSRFGYVGHVVYRQARQIGGREHLEKVLVLLLRALALRLLPSFRDDDRLVVVLKVKYDVSQFGLVLVGLRPLHAQLRDRCLAFWAQVDTSGDGLFGTKGIRYNNESRRWIHSPWLGERCDRSRSRSR